MNTIMKKLQEARVRVEVIKTGKNDFAKYSYYQIDVIYAESKKIFKELGITTVINTDIFEVAGTVYKKFTMDVINDENIDDKVQFSVITEPANLKGAQAPQMAGADITYCTKYLYGLALMLDDGKSDVDATNDHKPENIKKGLTRDDMISRFDSLPEDKKNSYMKDIMARENKTMAIPSKFIKKVYLDEIADKEKW